MKVKVADLNANLWRCLRPLPQIQHSVAGDGWTDIKTVVALRAGRAW